MRKISFVDYFLIGVTISIIGGGAIVAGGIVTDLATEGIKKLLGEGSASEASLIVKLLELSGFGAGAMLLLKKYPPEPIDKASKCDRISASAEAEES